MSSLPSSPDTGASEASREAAEQLLATVLAGIAPIWIVETTYIHAPGPVWQVTLVLPGSRGTWARRRYRYDIPSAILYFAGEQPLDPGTFAALRETARPFVAAAA